MEDNERIVLTTLVTAGAIGIITYVRINKRQKLLAKLNKHREALQLMLDHLTWMQKNASTMSHEEFINEYNDRMNFLNIVIE